MYVDVLARLLPVLFETVEGAAHPVLVHVHHLDDLPNCDVVLVEAREEVALGEVVVVVAKKGWHHPWNSLAGASTAEEPTTDLTGNPECLY